MHDSDEMGQFGTTSTLTTLGACLPSLHHLGWGLLLVGVAFLAVASLFAVVPLVILGAFVALPGALVLVFGYGRGALGFDTE